MEGMRKLSNNKIILHSDERLKLYEKQLCIKIVIIVVTYK